MSSHSESKEIFELLLAEHIAAIDVIERDLAALSKRIRQLRLDLFDAIDKQREASVD